MALIPTLRDVIRYSFMPKFGDLFTEVASEYFNAQLTTNNAKLLPYFQAAAVKLALAMALETQPVAFESDGVRMVTTTEGVEKVQAERVLQLANSCRVLGKQFLDDAESFVLKNLDNYPTYKNSSLNPVSKPVQNQIRISNNRVGAIMLKK